MKIGLILPRSEYYPTLPRDFVQSLRWQLSKYLSDTSCEFILEGIGTGGDDQVLSKLEKLIIQDEVTLTIAFSSVFFTKELSKMASQYQHPVVHLDFGGSVYQKSWASDYLIHLNSNRCEAAFLQGKRSAARFKTMALASSFYDGSYDILRSFLLGYSSGGGEVVYNYVGPMDYKSENYETLIQGINELKPEAVYCLFSYKEAEKVSQILIDSHFENDPALLISDTMLRFFNMNGRRCNYSSVSSMPENSSAVKQFTEAISQRYNREATEVDVLAAECASLISRKNAATWADVLKIESDEMLRGTYHLNESQTLVPHKFFEMSPSHEGNEELKIEAKAAYDLYCHFDDENLTGWKNPYLCT